MVGKVGLLVYAFSRRVSTVVQHLVEKVVLLNHFVVFPITVVFCLILGLNALIGFFSLSRS